MAKRASAKDRDALKKGATAARRAIARRSERRPRRRVARGSLGLLIAEGDSWFDYPLYDVLDLLESDGYEVEAVAHMGDNLEDMAHDERQLDRLAKAFERVGSRGRAADVRAILLSGGGNDIAGDEFALLLNHARSGLPALNEKIVEGVLDVRLREALLSLIGTAKEYARHYLGGERPIVVHGYGHAVPDGRGFLGGGWVLPGPWLDPGFRRKGHDSLEANTRVVRTLIDRHNATLRDVAARSPGVHFVDVRPLLSSDTAGRAYQRDWGNELHPTESGFRKVADAFAGVIGGL